VATSLKLTILTPEKRVVEGVEVQVATLPTHEGQIQVLPGHAAMVGFLAPGICDWLSSTASKGVGAVSFGFFEVKGSELTVLAETFEQPKDVNLERARTAQSRAEQALGVGSGDWMGFKKQQLKLQRSLIRQQVARHGSALDE